MAKKNKDRMEIHIQPAVLCSVFRMYDRYVEVAMTDTRKPIMSFPDFFNQLIVRGMLEYNKPLARLEKELKIT